MLQLTFSFKLEWGSYLTSIFKSASIKIGALARSLKLLSPEVGLCLSNSTIWSCLEYCCHISAGASSCFLELLHKL